MGSEERSKHDVFVNFRGPDVREGFLKNLHKALLRSGIKAFVDSQDLHKGQKLTPALRKAIERSLVAIVVFSRDYASSEWCLNELVKILECSKRKEQMVITVFRAGCYEDAMAKHEQRHGKDPDTVEKWRHALFIASNFPGLHLQDSSNEAKFINGVVGDVKAKLQHLEAKRKSKSITPNLHHRQVIPTPRSLHTFPHDHFQTPSTHHASWQSPSMLPSIAFLTP
ncbi:toll/interleukin-1 receptor-like protein isoform X2 [Rhodamnia argentea]|uniref:Toll/interleukin-1 receptor-like protein isoform X2 n=1 Tax=Rhodamnia argentea TaxID=178133 RepID=A0ABM3HUP5_9MYRT|nr:toll/interleukin-1 receptor-like protein isoform X2 [Rhodamnia argentea]